MSQPFERPGQLPEILRWHPEWFTDPIPEWWLREAGRDILTELAAVRLEAYRGILEVQMNATAKAIEIVRSARG
jgi:hypothetical protein